ncbi:hypothetical protein FRB90_012237 [Tulasnella sp. 427]|nr:hypothetical protein FRB90_012237 [Tulasnella sp. 427]
MESSEESRTIWAWTADPEDPTTLATERKSYQAPFDVHCLYAPRSLPSKLIAVSTAGTVACLSGDQMQISDNGTMQGGGAGSVVVKSMIITRQRCSFAPIPTPPSAVVWTIIQVPSEVPRVRLQVTVFDDDGKINPSVSGMVGLSDELNAFRDVTLDSSGHLSVLWSDCSWSRYKLARSSPDEPLNLIRHEPQVNLSRQKITSHTATSLIHLNTTHVLFASLEPGHTNVDILIWDLQYQAVLARRTVPLPSSVSNPRIQLIPTLDATQALLVVSTSLTEARGASTSLVYSVPLTVPTSSSLANAIGAAQSTVTNDWIEPTGGDSEEAQGLMTTSERDTLDRLDEALTREGVQAANDVVLRFQQSASLANISRDFAEEVCRRLLKPIPKSTGQAKADNVPSSVLPLLERGLVSNGYAEHEMGVVGAVVDRSDWVALRLCLERVRDIPEDALVHLLKRAISISGKGPKQGVNGMDVDSPPKSKTQSNKDDAPSLSELLAQVVQYPTTAGPLRVAMKKHLSVDDLVSILEALEQIIRKETQTVSAMTASDPKHSLFAQARTFPIVDSPRGKHQLTRSSDLQSIQFFQHILDTFLLSILSSPSPELQNSILSISTHIQSSVDLIAAFEKLRGPLEPFVRAQEERVLAEKERATKTGHTEQKWAKLKKRTERHRKLDEAVAVYQIETLTL